MTYSSLRIVLACLHLRFDIYGNQVLICKKHHNIYIYTKTSLSIGVCHTYIIVSFDIYHTIIKDQTLVVRMYQPQSLLLKYHDSMSHYDPLHYRDRCQMKHRLQSNVRLTDFNVAVGGGEDHKKGTW